MSQSTSSNDAGRCVRVVPTTVCPQGGYIVVGPTGSAANYNAVVFRVGENGKVLWFRNFEAIGPLRHQTAYSVDVVPAAAPNGPGFIVVGIIHKPWPDPTDVLAIRLNCAGDIIWAFKYEFRIDNNDLSDWPMCVKTTPNGDYVIVGYSNDFFGSGGPTLSYAFAMKLDDFGSVFATRTYDYLPTHQYFELNSVDPYREAGVEKYVAAGYCRDVAFLDPFSDGIVMKLDVNLAPEWARVYGVTTNKASYADYLTSIRRTSGGKFIVSGWTNSRKGGSFVDIDMLVMELKNNGMIDWAKVYDIPSSGPLSIDKAASIDEIAINQYIVAGGSYPFGALMNQDLTVLRLGAQGSLVWAKVLQPWPPYAIMNMADGASSIQAIGATGECIVAGGTNSFGLWAWSVQDYDFLVCKLDPLYMIPACKL